MANTVAPRVLVVDDQQDVASTLGALLIAEGVTVALAPDGEAALERLRTEPFDLAIIDMKMPPGEWGGVWLLRQLQSAYPLLPCIVLTGEGAQEQTVEALRAGAKDWIRKDEARQRLAESVKGVVADAQQRAVDAGHSRVPTPVAIAARRFDAASSPNTRLHLGLGAVETVLRVACAVGLSEAPGDQAPPLPKSLRSQLGRPSFGTWLDAKRALAELLPAAAAFHEFARCLDDEAVRPLVTLRNDLAHGFEPGEKSARGWVERLDATLRQTLSRAASFVQSTLTLPLTLEFDGSGFVADCIDIVGASPALPRTRRHLAEPVATGRVALAHASGRMVEAEPWVRTVQTAVHGEWDVLLFDGYKARNGNDTFAVGDTLRYLAVLSADRGRQVADEREAERVRAVLQP